jgi:hypothetical protein
MCIVQGVFKGSNKTRRDKGEQPYRVSAVTNILVVRRFAPYFFAASFSTSRIFLRLR